MTRLFSKLFFILCISIVILALSPQKAFAQWNGLYSFPATAQGDGLNWGFNIQRNDPNGYTGSMTVGFVAIWCRNYTGPTCDNGDPDEIGNLYYKADYAIINVPNNTGAIFTSGNIYIGDLLAYFPQYTWPCGRIQADVGNSDNGQTIGGTIYNTSVDCVAVPTPTPIPGNPVMSLIVEADTSNGGQATGQYGTSGLRSDDSNVSGVHGSNYYNYLSVQPKETSGKQPNEVALIGFAFGALGSPTGNSLGTLVGYTSGNNGFVVVYAYCGDGVSTCTANGQPFDGGETYVSYNGGSFQLASSNQNLAVTLLPGAIATQPRFRIQLYKPLGKRDWATYTFFKNQSGGTEFFYRSKACTNGGTCTNAALPLADDLTFPYLLGFNTAN